MIAPSRSLARRTPVTRHFEWSRLQGRSIASAYETLIPVISRPIKKPRDGRGGVGEARPETGSRQSFSEGA